MEEVARTARLHDEQRMALDAAQTLLVADLRASIPDPDTIVSDYVRPTVETVYAEAKALLDRHGPVLAGSAEAAISAPAAVGKAWGVFGELTSRHSALRTLHDRLTRDAVQRDAEGRFATFREDPRDPRVWGENWGVRGKWRPWPNDPRGYLGWLLTSGVTPWVPTAGERDARFDEVFPPSRVVGTVGGTMRVPANVPVGLAGL